MYTTLRFNLKERKGCRKYKLMRFFYVAPIILIYSRTNVISGNGNTMFQLARMLILMPNDQRF